MLTKFQVRMIDTCLRLHGQICPPEMLVIHEGTLEKFFRKNFSDEIRRLAVGGTMDDQLMSPSIRSQPTTAATGSQYQASVYAHSLQRTISTTSTSRPLQAYASALQLSRPTMTPPPLSPHETLPASPDALTSPTSPSQTPLQRHLAHLVRHGFNGVSSSPDNGDRLMDGGSPPTSMVNLSGSMLNSAASIASATGATSAGSIKGRFSSRFGSLSFRNG